MHKQYAAILVQLRYAAMNLFHLIELLQIVNSVHQDKVYKSLTRASPFQPNLISSLKIKYTNYECKGKSISMMQIKYSLYRRR